MLENIKKAERLVFRVLKDNPETRSDDRKLIVEVWKSQGLRLSEYQERLIKTKLLTPESITRARRKMQQIGIVGATKEVKQARMFEEKAIRRDFADAKERR